MKRITLRHIPEAVDEELRHVARRSNTSLNQAAIAALKAGLGLTQPARRRRDLNAIAGKWTAEEAQEFEKNTQGFGQVDEELWK